MSSPKILLVDDVKLFLELEKSYLHLAPAVVLTAGNGEEALRVVRAERPALVFLDLYMPVLDGVACCRAIKDDPELATTPVIMVTTGGKPEEEVLCREAGCDDFLTKPVDRAALLEKVRKYIPRWSGESSGAPN